MKYQNAAKTKSNAPSMKIRVAESCGQRLRPTLPDFSVKPSFVCKGLKIMRLRQQLAATSTIERARCPIATPCAVIYPASKFPFGLR